MYVTYVHMMHHNRNLFIKLLTNSTTSGKNTFMNGQTIVTLLKNNYRKTYSDSSSSLHCEFVGKLVGDRAAITYLPLHLPVAQGLVLQKKVGRQKM